MNFQSKCQFLSKLGVDEREAKEDSRLQYVKVSDLLNQSI